MNDTLTEATAKSTAPQPQAYPNPHASWHGLIYLIPMNLISCIVGGLVRIRFPAPFQRLLNQAFVALFKIDMAEAAAPARDYQSIEALFTRPLRPGLRPPLGRLVSPADGTLSSASPLKQGSLLQAKRFAVKAEELIYGESAAPSQGLALTHQVTVYLAPHNYHRVHAPAAGTVRHIYYVPGELWPVNQTFVRAVPRIFSRNERLTFELALDGGGTIFVVMVGALNVGRIATPLLPQRWTNGWGRQWGARPETWPLTGLHTAECGDELGTFMLGSTVILLFDETAGKRFELPIVDESVAVRVGESLEFGRRDLLG